MPSTDRELLVQTRDLAVATHALVKETHKAVFGNGRPGLMQTVAVLESQVGDIEIRAPSPREKRAAWTSIGVAVVMAVGALAKAVLFS